jgi:hypothetical protein
MNADNCNNASRRRFLEFLVGGPLLPYVAVPGAVFWQRSAAWAADGPAAPSIEISTPAQALNVFDLEELQDYVITHELLHFHAPNHGKLCKSLMRAHLGEHEQLEGELRRVARNKAMQRTASRSH